MTDQTTQIPLDPVAAYLLRERDFQRNEALAAFAQQRDLMGAFQRQAAETDMFKARSEELWSELQAAKLPEDDAAPAAPSA